MKNTTKGIGNIVEEEIPANVTGNERIQWLDERTFEIMSFLEETEDENDERIVKVREDLIKYFVELDKARTNELKRIAALEEKERQRQIEQKQEEHWQKEFDLKEAQAAKDLKFRQEEIDIKRSEIEQKAQDSKNKVISDIVKFGVIGLASCITTGIVGGVMIHCCHVGAGTELAEGGGITSPTMKKYGYIGWNDCKNFITTPRV